MLNWKHFLLIFIIGLFCINNPTSAQFYSNDPVSAQTHLAQGNVQGFNRYVYANNNPYKYVDPDGNSAALAACTAGPMGCAVGIGVTLVVAHHAVKGTAKALQGNNQFSKGSRKLDDLETIHDPDHPQNDPAIGELDDNELENAINNPSQGDKITVKGNKVYDGNTRINEAKNRGFDGHMDVPVDELPNPVVNDDDPLGGYGDN